MTKKIERLITYVFSPLFAYLFGITALIFGKGIGEFTNAFMFMLIGGLPVIVVYVKEYLEGGSIDATRKDRDSIFLGAVFSFTLSTIWFGSMLGNDSFWMNLSIINTIYYGLYLLVNKYFDKASQHAGAFSLWIMILADKVHMGFAFAFSLLPVIIWTRLDLRKHSWLQIMWGLALGMFVGLVSWLF